jgi:GntR family transcriptional repressor for pyruvate dehydrogenase complex
MLPATALALKKLRPVRATDGIVAQIKELILQGSLRPGDRLPSERQLAQAWRVGRPTVREAIQQLEGLGFIEVRPARGSFVRSLTPRAIDEPLRRAAEEEGPIVAQILDLRMALEGWVAAEAARLATPSDIRRIARLADDLHAAAERGQPLSGLDTTFHRAIAEASKNTVILHMMDSLRSLGATVRTFKARVGFRQTRGRSFTDCHREIARAIAAHDPERARRAMVAHLRMVKEMLAEAQAAARRRKRGASARARVPAR